MPTIVLPFRKAACENPAIVTLLGANAEMHRYVSRLFAGDIAYLQNGRLVAEPGRAADGMAHMVDALWQLLRGQVEPGLPLVAIAPRPTGKACAPPEERIWRDLPQEIDPSLRKPIL